MDELAMTSKNKNIRKLYIGINYIKRGQQSRSTRNLVKDGNGDLLADSHNILNRRKTTSLSYLMYIGSVTLGREKYIQLSH
jgi:hypothetical protein